MNEIEEKTLNLGHFTTFDNFKKILDSNVLWVTADNKNDPAEGIFLAYLFEEYVCKETVFLDVSYLNCSFFGDGSSAIIYNHFNEKILNGGKVYTSSFCKLPVDTVTLPFTQWAYYGNGGHGVCLKFKIELTGKKAHLRPKDPTDSDAGTIPFLPELDLDLLCPTKQLTNDPKVLRPLWDQMTLAKVHYINRDLKSNEGIDQKLEEMFHKIKKWEPAAAALALNQLRPIIKSGLFHHENEYRVIVNASRGNNVIKRTPSYCESCHLEATRYEIPVENILDSVVLGPRFFEDEYNFTSLPVILEKLKKIRPDIKIDFEKSLRLNLSEEKLKNIATQLGKIEPSLEENFRMVNRV